MKPEMGYQVDVMYTDFSKVFDSVDHKLLIQKLISVEICGPMLKWLNNYLTRRSGDPVSDPASLNQDTWEDLTETGVGFHYGTHTFKTTMNLYIQVYLQ